MWNEKQIIDLMVLLSHRRCWACCMRLSHCEKIWIKCKLKMCSSIYSRIAQWIGAYGIENHELILYSYSIAFDRTPSIKMQLNRTSTTNEWTCKPMWLHRLSCAILIESKSNHAVDGLFVEGWAFCFAHFIIMQLFIIILMPKKQKKKIQKQFQVARMSRWN